MILTNHFVKRTRQRSFNDAEVSLILDYGTPKGDKYILGKRELKKLLKWKSRPEYDILEKLYKKSGAVIVAVEDFLITAYCITRMSTVH